ncbi:ABC transporter permease [Desulfuromonas carbonis]|uniref:ABC transporter permease n=1 Tax=Desulfuromonas sp. DDH964 TaxID=1823759 RepID=UPI00078B1FCD|nr:ABC transporter permease [Desulfuromonas sp. DDH964]AMV71389.1 ABC transporter [Desulfuromonas sp. DDH964]
MTFFATFGHWALKKTSQLLATLRLILAALSGVAGLRNQATTPVLLKQIYFTGFESAKVIIVISMAIGTVIIAQVMLLVGSANASLTGKVLIWTVVRELGPMLTALIVIARSGAAIASELGTMKLNGEVETLLGLGISPIAYLATPRILGGMLAVFALTVYFEAGAILGGVLVASFGWHLPLEQFSQGLYAALTLQDLAMSAVKSLLFGLFITAAACQQGLAVGRSATMIPQAATLGVMHSLFLVFVLDGIVTLTFQYLHAG